MNSIHIIGNITKDLELKQTQSGKNVCALDVAVSRRFNREETDFFKVIAWEKLAETCCNYLKKGSKVAFRGEMQSRTYEHDGAKRTVWELRADEVEFLSPRADEATTLQPQAKRDIRDNPIEDDTLPF